MNFENFVLDLKYGWWLVFPSYYSCTTDKYLEASITFWFLSRLHLWLITDTNLFSNLVWLHVNNSLAENQEIKSRKMQTFQIMPNFSLCTDQRVFFGIKRRKKMFLQNSLHQVIHWHSWMNHHSILKFKTISQPKHVPEICSENACEEKPPVVPSSYGDNKSSFCPKSFSLILIWLWRSSFSNRKCESWWQF